MILYVSNIGIIRIAFLDINCNVSMVIHVRSELCDLS